MKRKDMKAHEEDCSYHFHMAVDAITMLKQECTLLKMQNKSMSEKVLNFTTFKLSGYQSHKDHKTRFLSPSFYSHPMGYYVQVEVYANGVGDGTGTHVSVYARCVKAHLKWPLLEELPLHS